MNTKERYGVPALLSFLIPGLGQIVKGHILRGILFFIVMVFSVISIIFFVGLITTPIIFVWNVYDAYNSQVEGD